MSARLLVPSLVMLALLLAGFELITELTVMPWVVAGRSMEPALSAGDRVLVDRWTYRHRPPRVGEVVLVLGSSDVPLVKRVAAPPGSQGAAPLGARSQPALWVVGDNRSDSVDSRHFGPLPRERFGGRVVYRYWPPARAGRIRQETLTVPRLPRR